MMMRILVLCALLAAMLAPGAGAHELRPGYLQVTQHSDTDYAVSWKAPVRVGRPLSVDPQFPADCDAGERASREGAGATIVSTWAVTCETPMQERSIVLAGLETTLTDILVRFEDKNSRIQTIRATPENPVATIAGDPSPWQVARTYFHLGMDHIFEGVDHLLFVLALVLLISGVRKLVEAITAFTVAHSLTLASTTLGLFSLPPSPVEAVIALSIVFLASELANRQAGRQRLSERYPWLVAFSFGLLHGFGFAGALREIGFPQEDIAIALVTFNLGVEAGQLVFVAIVLVLLAGATRLIAHTRIDQVASYAIGVPAAYWLIERIV
ncbi:MAG: HupE/UreJ family protein [Pseudomonadota bacterium]